LSRWSAAEAGVRERVTSLLRRIAGRSHTSISSAHRKAIDDFVAEAVAYPGRTIIVPPLSDLRSSQAILSLDRSEQIPILLVAVEALVKHPGVRIRDTSGYRIDSVLKALASRLLKRHLPYVEGDILYLIDQASLSCAFSWQFPIHGILATVERHIHEHQLSPSIEHSLRRLQKGYSSHRSGYDYGEFREVRKRIERILAPDQQGQAQALSDNPWARDVRADLQRLSPKQKRAFHQLFEHAQSAERKTRPTKAWLAEAKGTANEIDTTIVLKFIREWLEGFPVDIRRPDPNMEVVRGLIWYWSEVGQAG
jgi:hypothetical protein